MGKLLGKTEHITLDDFTAKFFKELKHGQILGFKQSDGSMQHWRVSKVSHKKQEAWIQPWKLYDTIEEVQKARPL